MKKKKEKITYIDDGRLLADMSKRHTSSPVKEIVRTYFGAMKMMLLPTAVAVGFIVVIYILIYCAFKFM